MRTKAGGKLHVPACSHLSLTSELVEVTDAADNPRGVGRFKSHNAHRATGTHPASQPQASRDEDLQASH